MSRKITPPEAVDNSPIQTYKLGSRPSKVAAEDLHRPYSPGGSFVDFLNQLPNFLQANDLRSLAAEIAKAHGEDKVVALGMGAHNIKVGLQPLYVDLMERGIISSIAMNGACIVHDFEMAHSGRTSEDVDDRLSGGRFGMARETGQWLNKIIKRAADKGLGLGQAVGEAIWEENLPNKHVSLLANAYRLGVVATVHVAVGTDVIHMHPEADGAAIGAASMNDFHRFCAVVSELEQGVYLNIGSAVILPEVFLKAVSLVRNKGRDISRFTTADFDFVRHYRPTVNVVRRPTGDGGKGMQFTGPHEILIPLLFAAVLETLENSCNFSKSG